VSDVNAALAAVAFSPAANWDQSVTISTRIRDAADTGPADGTITLDVTAVNDAPGVSTSGGSTAYTENATVTVDSGLTLSDADNTTLSSATVAITLGFDSTQDVLAFTNDGSTMGNIAASYDATSGVLTLTSAGSSATVSEWQAALRAVTYANNSEAPDTSDRTIRFTVNDGAAESSATRTVSVTSVNDAPDTDPAKGYVNSGASTETGGLVVISSAMLHEGDVDDATTGITYTITSAPTSGTLFIDVNGNGLEDGGEALSATSTFTQDDVDQGRIKYLHGGGAGTSDSFTFSVADGGEDGAAALTGQVFSINIAARPVVAIGGGAPAYAEGGTPSSVAPNLTITDGDSVNMAGATVTITDFVAGDALEFTDQNGIVGSYNNATGVLTLTGAATRAQYETALRAVVYSTTNDNPATGAGNTDRVIRFAVSDGTLTSTGQDAVVAVSNANDAPALDATAAPALTAISEDANAPQNGVTVGSAQGATLVSSLVAGITDVDTGALSGVALLRLNQIGYASKQLCLFPERGYKGRATLHGS
jgi:hypothetical protein